MATITSPGLASGLDVKSIVSQLVALERAPLQTMQRTESSLQAKMSVFGSIKSAVSAMADAATKLANPANFEGTLSSSSDSASVGVTSSSTAAASKFSITVTNLAQAQSAASDAFTPTTSAAMGAGSITITSGAGTPVTLDIAAGEDSLTAIAAKINDAKAGVTATVVKDATGERLLMRSAETGAANGFTVDVTTDPLANPAPALQKLAFGPSAAPGGMVEKQAALNAKFSLDGIDLESATNSVKDSVPGMTFILNKVTTAPVEISVSVDRDAMTKNVKAFVDAYNSINNLIATTTKYDAETKVAGSLQGDRTAIGLQNAMREMARSITNTGGGLSRLSDIGVTAGRDGNLSIDSSKLSSALVDVAAVKKLFTVDTGVATSTGFGIKLRDFANGLIASTGSLQSRQDALKSNIDRNQKEMVRVNERAARSEVRLLAQYNAMDSKLGMLNGLSAFVNQQVTLWNKNSA